MTIGIVGTKQGMTRIFTEDGRSVPVTVVQATPNRVTQVKNLERDGYQAIQVTYGVVKASRINRPHAGLFKKTQVEAGRSLTEFTTAETELEVGGELTVANFAAGQKVDVTGQSKGKGFQGVIKHWGFSGGRAAHGSKFHRGPGSIGMSASPARVHRGKKMPGQMGNARVTQHNLEIVEVRADQNLILVKGAIPGPNQGLVLIRKCVKA